MTKLDYLSAVLGAGFSIVGLFAFTYPALFFNLLPEYYGNFNLHFVKDAGIAFLSSGILFSLSLKALEWKLPLMFGGALFVVLHGAFHIQMLAMGMAPTALDFAIEVIVIISPSVLAALAVLLQFIVYRRRGGLVETD